MTKTTIKRPFAVFDIDGTLIRWQLYHAIAEELIKLNFLEPADVIKIKKIKRTWEHRVNKSAYEDYESQLMFYIEKIIKTIPTSTFYDISLKVFNTYKNKNHRYTLDLINNLRAKNYLLFFISGSPEIIVKMMTDYYNFDDFGGSHLIEKDNFLDHYSLRMTRKNKADLLRKFIKKHHATSKNSIAIGDSDSDIEMLLMVETPLVFNPNQKLLTFAKNNNWKIIIERKNVIYELEAINGQYVLANTK